MSEAAGKVIHANLRLVRAEPGSTDVVFRDLATGPAGTVYLVDERNANNLYSLAPTGILTSIPLATPLAGMVSLVYDSQSANVYAVERRQISLQRIDPATGADRIHEFCLPAVTGIPEEGAAVAEHSVVSAPRSHPNPFCSATTVEFTFTREMLAQADVFDVAGRRVRRLANRLLEAGQHRLVWDGRDDAGRDVSSGVYFVRVAGGGLATSLRVALSR